MEHTVRITQDLEPRLIQPGKNNTEPTHNTLLLTRFTPQILNIAI